MVYAPENLDAPRFFAMSKTVLVLLANPFSIFGFHVVFDEGCTIGVLNMCMHSYKLSDRYSFLTRRMFVVAVLAPQRR